MNKTLLHFIIFLFIPIVGVAQKIEIPYDFPVKPNTEEWKKLKTGKQMLEVCQIPENILEKITTKALVETCMNYPLFGDFIYTNNEFEGINWIINNFNGLKELRKRNNGTSELIRIYEKMNTSSVRSSDENGVDNPILRQQYIELLLSSDILFNQLNNDERIQLLEISMDKYNEKLRNSNIYGLSSIKKSLFIAAKVYNKQNAEAQPTENNKIVRSFIENINTISPTELSEVSRILMESYRNKDHIK